MWSSMWSWWKGRRAREQGEVRPPDLPDHVKEALVGEAEAVVEGRLAERLLEQGRFVPAWAWLNALAHRSPNQVSALAAVASAGNPDSWARATFEIATAMGQLPDDEARLIARSFFLPLELNALAGKRIPGGAGQVLKALQRRLNA